MTITAAQLQEFLGDRYTIRQPLGGGSMSLVFAADDLRHGRPVAIKVLLPDYVATLAAERFNREIQIAARLQHPHIVPLLDSGETHGVFYLVMPLIEGETLRARLVREGRLPVRDVLRILADVADALAYAHRKGIIHRDIKPDNILLAGRHALVADFGVAKAVSEALSADRNLTGGVALGTPAYMAPEQATADPALDHRVDVYAFGILGYELLAGRPPFDGDTPHEILTAQVLSAPAPIETHRPDTPPALASLLMRCLAKSPAERWAGIEELQGPLEGLATPTSGITPVGMAPVAAASGRRRLAAAAVAALLLAGAAYLGLRERSAAVLPTLSQRQLTFLGNLKSAALSPDGQLLAYVAAEADGDRLRVTDLRGGEPLTLLTGRELAGLAWSADGAEIRYLAVDSTDRTLLHTVPRLGGADRTLTNKSVGVLSPSGDRLAVLQRGSRQLEFIHQATGDTTVARLGGFLWQSDPAITTDGEAVALTTSTPAERRYAVLVVRRRDLVPVEVARDTAILGTPAWAPDGRSLFFLRGVGPLSDLMRLRLGEDATPLGPPERLASGLAIQPDFVQQLSVSGDGRSLVYVRGDRWSNLALVSLGRRDTAMGERLLTMGSAFYEAGRLSPDGKTIAYVRQLSAGASLELQPASGGAHRILGFRQTIRDIAWAPDGTRIAAATTDSFANPRVELFPIDGTGARVLGQFRAGSTIGWLDPATVLATREGNRAVLAVPLAGGEAAALAGVDSMGWTFWPVGSPDGSRVAYFENFGQSGRGVFEVARGGASPRRLLAGYHRPLAWSADGQRLYISNSRYLMDPGRLQVLSRTGGAPELVTVFPRGVEVLDVHPASGIALVNIRDLRADAWAIDLSPLGAP